MAAKEAQARIKINKLLEEAGWRLLDGVGGKANVMLEANVKLDALGDNFEATSNGFVDFLLLDERGHPVVVLEAKSEDKNPLAGKEQARKYARGHCCDFVILSNGNLHYLWDLRQGNPELIVRFPSPASISEHRKFEPNPNRLTDEVVGIDYIVRTQYPDYESDASYRNLAERDAFILKHGLRFLRDYQKRAVHKLQDAVAEGQTRFLFEMATGTGKTLTAAAIVKLFLRTSNAHRVLFLVDRLELENQAKKDLDSYLKNTFTTVVYKERRDAWRGAQIVVTTVQSLLFNNKYRRLFSPTDFDLVISDEAHRSIGGNARAVFEYFVGYKLGLTATPRDYLKGFNPDRPSTRDPREHERRLLLDTYQTFGCASGQPTFRYSLLDGVREGHLISPVVVDARTDVTARLLADEGYAVVRQDADDLDGDDEDTFFHTDFEKTFFSDATNRVFCETFLQHALRDPVSGEIGKSIVFAVSQNHAAKLAQLLNELADLLFPGKYQSDFAVQVTSSVTDAQQFTIQFAENKLLGSANFIETYKTSKARVCVTVGMMTTGYDCPDLLNIALMRPVFSPSDFVQIKGRGTRKYNFLKTLHDDALKPLVAAPEKTQFKFFDFFANCEYFEETFNYDEVLRLPARTGNGEGKEAAAMGGARTDQVTYSHLGGDAVSFLAQQQVGPDGMKIDRMFFERFEEAARADAALREQIENGQWDQAVEYVVNHLLDKPAEFFTLDKLRRAAGVDRRLTLKEILQKVFGLIPAFKSKDEMLEDAFQAFILTNQTRLADGDAQAIEAMKYFFKAYVTDASLRSIIDGKQFTELYVNPAFGMADFNAVPADWRSRIPEYVKDYVSLNPFM
ncbi:DEAD/DEAH box helicase family protein [Ralstonia sp.]|uniref:DEAD/DEAH box helicase family protein n=1 Tax=Ralstonia sp. TaxID=54061 RepID=UPI0031D25E54